MKAFICWSGPLSEKLGEALRNWMPKVIQSVEPYFTPSDVEKGARWLSEIAEELNESKVGLLCVTVENIHSDWLLFEAGALSKKLEKTHVCPLLFGVKPTDLAGPLRQFQATSFEMNDFRKLVNLINECLGDRKLPQKTLDAVFQKWWPDLEESIEEILSDAPKSDEPVRSDRDMLEELLLVTRRREATNRRPIPATVAVEILDKYTALHNQQVNSEGGYQETLDLVKEIRDPIMNILRYVQTSSEVREQFEIFKNLTFEVLPKSQEPDEDDIPF